MRDENGFTPEEAQELRKIIKDIEKGKGIRHAIVEE